MASKQIVILLVLLLNIIAFGLAVSAERRRNTVQVIKDQALNAKYCLYNSENKATGYSLGACFCLLASQIIVIAASRCLCCGNAPNPGGSKACAVILFICCWVTFIIAVVFLVAGAAKNTQSMKYRFFYGGTAPSCETVKRGVFAAGAAFTFFTTIFSVSFYILYNKARDESCPKDAVGQEDEARGSYTALLT